MSILNPKTAREYVIKKKNIRELLIDLEIGEDTMKTINERVVQMLLAARDRTRGNKRKRMFPIDL
jgi:hypothetical protein